MAEELTPPEALTPPEELTPPKPVAPIKKQQATKMIKLDPQTIEQLDVKIREFVDEVLESEVQSDPFKNKVAAIHNLGTKEIRKAANVSNRILEQPIRGLDEDSAVSSALLELRRIVEDLDPTNQDGGQRKLLGIIPLGNKLTDYFQKYQSSQKQIDAILNALYHGQDTLRKDNAVLEQEKVNLWNIMQRLQQYIYVCQELDEAMEKKLATIESQNPEKARVVKEEMLFYMRQKVQDLMTQLAVSVQGYLAMDMIRKSNLELIKGVDRASTTTVSALRTAVIVAQALSNQRLVLDQITALNTTTGNLIESTSEMMKQQSERIYRQASESTVDMAQLQTAFNNLFQTLDMVADYKVRALDHMSETIKALSTEVTRARSYVDRVRGETVLEVSENLALPEEDEADENQIDF